MDELLKDFEASDPLKSWWPFIVAVIVGITTTIRSYIAGPKCPSQATITGKTVVITGGSSGIGREVVKELLRRGGRLIVGVRNVEKARERLREAKVDVSSERLILRELDLSLLASVRKFVDGLADERAVDILINNGGIIFQPFGKTAEGLEQHFVVNYLSHFLLTHLLLPKLRAAPQGRVINVSAQAHYVGDIFLDDVNIEGHYTANKAFGQSKLALVMMAVKMAKDLEGTNVTINAMHPGLVRNTTHMENSPFNRSLLVKVATWPWTWLLMKTPEQGAQTIVYLSVATELSKVSGKYFSNCAETDPSEKAHDWDLSQKLYKKSLELSSLHESIAVTEG